MSLHEGLSGQRSVSRAPLFHMASFVLPFAGGLEEAYMKGENLEAVVCEEPRMEASMCEAPPGEGFSIPVRSPCIRK